MKRTLSFAFIFLQVLIFVNGDGFYTVVAPGTIQSNYEYTVSVTLHNNPEPASVKVGITGPKYNESKTVEVAPSHTELIRFDVPTISGGEYMLVTEGIKGLIFKNSTDLNYNDDKPKVYIQTDKAVYKPGDLVQYRILALDENTRPAKLREPLNVGIRDGAGNHIKQLKDIKLNKGVFSGEFQLSEQPVLGNWLLEVTLGKESKQIVEKKFEVDKYVLPKFSVDIETAKDVALQDGVIKVTVRSKYTYGKPVKGKATITVFGTPRTESVEKSIDIDGKGHLEFDIVKDLKLDKKDLDVMGDPFRSYVYMPSLQVLAVVTEGYTGNQQNKTTSINLEKSRYRITVPDQPTDYFVNKPFEIKAFIKKLDGSPVQDAKSMAKLTVKKYEDYFSRNDQKKPKENKELVYESKVDENGMVTFTVTLPDEEYYGDVVIQFEEKEHRLSGFRVKTLKKDEDGEKADETFGPLKVVMQTKEPRLGEDVVFDVKSDNVIPYFVYVITGRGKMLKHEYVKVAENQKSHTVTFKPTFDMVPSTKIYAYYVKDGDLHFNEASIAFKEEFENKIEITAPEQTKPGEEVTLNIKTDPDSFVGLLGVDQSVLLLKSGNDFDPKKIIGDLSSYEARTPWIRGYGEYPGKESGLVTLTNANYPYNKDAIILHSFIRGPPGPPGLPGLPGPPGPSRPALQFPVNARPGPPPISSGSQIEVKIHDYVLWQYLSPRYVSQMIAHTVGSKFTPTIRKDFVDNWIFKDVEKYLPTN